MPWNWMTGEKQPNALMGMFFIRWPLLRQGLSPPGTSAGISWRSSHKAGYGTVLAGQKYAAALGES